MAAPRLRLLPCLLATALACASGDPAAPPDTAAPAEAGTGPDTLLAADTLPRSFVVEGKLAVKPTAGGSLVGGTVPDRHDFTLRLDPQARTLTVGAHGSAATVAVASADGLTFETTGPVPLALPNPSGCGSAGVTYRKITATVRGDRVEGNGQGELRATGGDVAILLEATLTFTGGPDGVAPSLGPDRMNVDPIGRLHFPASEPLPPASQARLVGPLGSGLAEIALQPIVSAKGGAVGGFQRPDGTALAWGASYELVAEPPTDLAGNPYGRTPRLTTGPAPALLAESNLGFEEAGPSVGGLALVDASFLPPISGQRSLFLAPGGGAAPGSAVAWNHRFRVRLAVPTTAGKVSLKARPITLADDCCTGRVIIRAAAAGGPITQPGPIDWKSPRVRQQTPGRELFLGEVRDVELPLPAGHGEQVIVDISNLYEGCGPLPAGMGLLIDDLRVE